MPTSFDTVIDRALITVDDYTLVKLFNRSEQDFQVFVDGLLIKAIPYFTQCKQSLTYDPINRQFDADLTDMEIQILADFWSMTWMARKVQNTAQFVSKLQNNAMKNHSEAQNLKEKQELFERIRERTYQLIVDYQLQDIASLY